MTMIEGKENTMAFAFRMILKALEIEVKTGRPVSRMNTLRAAQNYGVTAKTRKGAIKQMRAMLGEEE